MMLSGFSLEGSVKSMMPERMLSLALMRPSPLKSAMDSTAAMAEDTA